jgi:hypothetical protein
MNMRIQLISTVIFSSMAVFAQPNATTDTPFQVKYAGNLAAGDSVFNITNTGANGGNICVNVYTFSPDEQLISCCACTVTPNGLVSLSARNDLIVKTLTPAVPSAIVVKLLSTTGGPCNASTPRTRSAGLAAWGTTIHNIGGVISLTETPFKPSSLGGAELDRISALCGFIQTNGSGFGICNSCRPGALGGAKL